MAAYNKDGNIIATIAQVIDIADIKANHPTYNDDQILSEAITQAKIIGETAIIKWDGEDIHFSGTVTHDCKEIGGIDFNGSTIYMPDHDGGIIINVVPDDTEDIIVQASELKTYYTTNENLKGKIFRINDVSTGNEDMCLGYRYENPNEITVYSAPTIITNQDGKYTTDNLYLPPSSGNVTCYNVHEHPDITFEICNGVIISNSSANMSTFLKCSRSNTHLHNFVLKGRSEAVTFHWGIFRFDACCYIEVDHIFGINPLRANPGGGYFLSFLSVSFAYMHDLSVGDSESWGSIGFRFLTNTVTERCHLRRWDCHFAQYGYNVVRDSTIGFATYGIGQGVFLIENCIFLLSNDNCMIQTRNDCAGVFDGDVVVRNCKFYPMDRTVSNITILRDSCNYARPQLSKVVASPKAGRYIEKCVIPSGCKEIFNIGTSATSDKNMYSGLTLCVKESDIPELDTVFGAYAADQTIKKIELLDCTISGLSYITKTLHDCIINICRCEYDQIPAKVVKNTGGIHISDSVLYNVITEQQSDALLVNGSIFNGSQSVSNFTAYALSGNIASDMASVNKHS